MKVLMLNGSPHEKGCTYTALAEVAGELNQAGIETEIMHVGGGTVHACMGCGACGKLGNCIYSDDKVNEAVEKMRQSGFTGTLCFGRRGYHLLSGPFLLFRKQCCCP